MEDKKTAIIIGGGQSVQEGISLGLFDKIKDKDVWCINFNFMVLPFLPKREIWLDVAFFRTHIDQLQDLCVKGVKCYTKKHDKYNAIPEITQFATTRDINEKDKLFIGFMGLSGFFALSLAVKEEYDLCYILGFDFGSISNDKNTHFYQHTLKVNSSGFGRPELYQEKNNQPKSQVKDFEYFLSTKTKIVNVSPQSKIPYFPKIDYLTFFKEIENI